MPPWQGGGGMIQTVSFEETTFAPAPARFEAGTPPIAQVIGLGAAIEYLARTRLGRRSSGTRPTCWPTPRTGPGPCPAAACIGTAPERVGVLSLVLEGIHPHDVGTVLDLQGVAVRASHHCAQPLMRRFGVPGTVRASFGLYNTRAEVDRLIEGLQEARQVFRS